VRQGGGRKRALFGRWHTNRFYAIPYLLSPGRHPLLEVHTDAYVPSTTRLGGGSPSVLLVGGASGAGKTAWASSLALTTALAHAGSFVPASSAVIGLTDRIFFAGAACRGRGGLAAGAGGAGGALAASLGRAAAALRHATDRSLVVFDELGSGTLAADGAGLVAAAARALAARGARAAVTTHFAELLTPGVLPDTPSLGHAHLAVLEGGGSGGGPLLLRRLAAGKGDGRSFGLACAAAEGVPGPVIQRAGMVAAALMGGAAVPADAAVAAARAAASASVRAALQALAALPDEIGEEDGGACADALRAAAAVE